MNAHVIENGVVVNTIFVDSLDCMPNLIDASIGGSSGDSWDGQIFTHPIKPRDIKAEIAALEAQITPRRTREAILDLDNNWLANKGNEIDALRAQL